jgi:serine/threonine protein kinase
MLSAFRDDLLLSYEDVDLVRCIRDARRLSPFSAISLLSANYVSKEYQPGLIEDTLKAMELARRLGVRVPSVKRVVEFEGMTYCIMERIEGTTLEEVWWKLSWLVSLKLALQLRRYLCSLRSITSSTAGSLMTGECRSFWLDDLYRLPLKSSRADLTSFIAFWVSFTNPRVAMKAASDQIPSSTTPPKTYSPSTAALFVFTHHDLAPRNILLDGSGQLWLVDWDIAGCYPPYFEYSAMHNFIPESWTWLARIRWNLFTWIAAGRWEKERYMLEQIRSKFTRFPAGRRFHLLKRGGPSRRSVN